VIYPTPERLYFLPDKEFRVLLDEGIHRRHSSSSFEPVPQAYEEERCYCQWSGDKSPPLETQPGTCLPTLRGRIGTIGDSSAEESLIVCLAHEYYGYDPRVVLTDTNVAGR